MSFYYPDDYIVSQNFDDPDYDTIVVSSRSKGSQGTAFKVKHAEVTSGSYGLRLILKPFTPVEHWDGVPVYELPESASIVEALLRDACAKLTTLGPYGQLDYRVLYDAWQAGRNYSQQGLRTMAARYLGAQMDDVPQLKALDIYLEASEDVTSHAHQRLAEKALSRVCKGPILGIPAEDLQEMSAPAWLKIMIALRRQMADMLTPAINTLNATALLIPNDATYIAVGLDASIKHLQYMQTHLALQVHEDEDGSSSEESSSPDTEAAESASESPTDSPELEEAVPSPARSDSASRPPSPTESEVLDIIRSYIQHSQ